MLYQIKHMRARVRLTEDEMIRVLQGMNRAGYTPAMLDSRTKLCTSLGIENPDLTQLRFRPMPGVQRWPRARSIGDVFFRDDAVFYLKQDAANLYMVVRDDGELRGITEGLEVIEAGVIGSTAAHIRRLLSEFCKAVNNAVLAVCSPERMREFELTWKDDFTVRQKLTHLISRNAANKEIDDQMRFTEASSSGDLALGARLLANEEVRDTLRFIDQAGKIMMTDFQSSMGRRLQGDIPDQLRMAGLIQIECLLVCSKTGNALTRLEDRRMLDDPAIGNLISPFSGKRFREEKIEEVLTLTDRARSLLGGDTWLRMCVIEAIEPLGFPRGNIAVNQSVDPEEIDLALQPFERLMFVKIKSGEFGLRDAYPFNFRAHCYGAEVAAVIATGGVTPEARALLEELSQRDERGTRGYELHIINSLDGLRDQLKDLFSELSLHALRYRVDPLSSVLGLDLAEIIMRRLAEMPQASAVEEASPPADDNGDTSMSVSLEQIRQRLDALSEPRPVH